ncbi:MAG: metallopeptidase family protein [bacterium]
MEQGDEAPFEQWVRDALDSLPEEVHRRMRKHGVEVIIQDRPSVDIRRQFGDDLFGLFTGRQYGDEWSSGTIEEPTRIELYEDVFLRHFQEIEPLKNQVQSTVLHEVGHFLGMDEEELRDLGY